MLSRREMLQRCLSYTPFLACPSLAVIPALADQVDELRLNTLVYAGNAFGTRWKLALSQTVNPENALAAITSVIANVQSSMSPYEEDSEISKFNQARAVSGSVVSTGLATVVQAALEVARQSNGAFDPTVGPWVNRYGFGPIEGGMHGSFTDIILNTNKLGKKRDDTTLDLCGIAKGYALDQMARVLALAGYTDFLLELGGELKARGLHPSGRHWRIQIENTASSASETITMDLIDVAIATSGLSTHSYTILNERYGHLIDPVLHRCATPQLHSVSVFHRSAMLADAWATALFVLGATEGPKLASALELEAVFITL